MSLSDDNNSIVSPEDQHQHDHKRRGSPIRTGEPKRRDNKPSPQRHAYTTNRNRLGWTSDDDVDDDDYGLSDLMNAGLSSTPQTTKSSGGGGYYDDPDGGGGGYGGGRTPQTTKSKDEDGFTVVTKRRHGRNGGKKGTKPSPQNNAKQPTKTPKIPSYDTKALRKSTVLDFFVAAEKKAAEKRAPTKAPTTPRRPKNKGATNSAVNSATDQFPALSTTSLAQFPALSTTSLAPTLPMPRNGPTNTEATMIRETLAKELQAFDWSRHCEVGQTPQEAKSLHLKKLRGVHGDSWISMGNRTMYPSKRQILDDEFGLWRNAKNLASLPEKNLPAVYQSKQFKEVNANRSATKYLEKCQMCTGKSQCTTETKLVEGRRR